MSLKKYWEKRDFTKTKEPSGKTSRATTKSKANSKSKTTPKPKVIKNSKIIRKPKLLQKTKPLYLIQKHAASHLHYDLRLEMEGVLKSWAVPKGPSLDTHVKRLAIEVEDHPIEYGDFEGTIPKGQYGGGTVMLWDTGTFQSKDDPVKSWYRGDITFEIKGKKLKGLWKLIKIRNTPGHEYTLNYQKSYKAKNMWLFFKLPDKYATKDYDIVEEKSRSVKSRRSMDGIAKANTAQWKSNK